VAQGFVTLTAVPEWAAHDPFGRLNRADAPSLPFGITDDKGAVMLRAARNGYVSFRVLVQGAGQYRLTASIRGGLELDLYKAWYHRMHVEKDARPEYWPDALIPVRGRKPFRLPDAENEIEGQTAQEFWVDIFVPPDAKPGRVTGRIRLVADGEATSLLLRVRVLDKTIPAEPCIVMDHNSYSSGVTQVRRRRLLSERFWRSPVERLHNCYRMFHEHRGLFHNLGYKQCGVLEPIYAPRVRGRGREIRLTDWELFDLLHAPLLDGSAFAAASPGMPRPRRPARPPYSMYTPLNPTWPADYLWWGDKGYEVEFVRGVRQFDAHLRERGWTRTRMEFFFNHKKRHRSFGWDGDEMKYMKDAGHHLEMIRMWEKATAGSPVPWVYRLDASWQVKNQFEVLGGHRNFWVCGGMVRWYPQEVARVIQRGETVWWYGGAPRINAPSSSILQNVYLTWARGMHGYCAWSTINPGPDPWFDCSGSATALLYPGERFGIKGPLPSIRLKVQRNGIQDIDLIDQAAKAAGNLDTVRRQVSGAVPIPLWEAPPPNATKLPPEDWDAYNLVEDHEPEHRERKQLDPLWWRVIRQLALKQERK